MGGGGFLVGGTPAGGAGLELSRFFLMPGGGAPGGSGLAFDVGDMGEEGPEASPIRLRSELSCSCSRRVSGSQYMSIDSTHKSPGLRVHSIQLCIDFVCFLC